MRWRNSRASDNVEDRRAGGVGGIRGGGKSLGAGAIILALVALFFGVDPRIVLNLAGGLQAPQSSQSSQSAPSTPLPANDEAAQFVAHVLGDTEDTWRGLFAQSGQQYQDPKLVLFRDSTPTACGTGQAAMGPFYCPADRTVYIDLGFFDELDTRFGAPGDFAQAYVIGHEVAHHVQNLLGIADRVHRARQQADPIQANQLSVRMELQADCLAGVWAHHAEKSRDLLETGDVEEGLNAATAIGDDTLQRQAQGRVVPDSFTHGSSRQRVTWFKRGLESGQPKLCDTFTAQQL
jgi:uncharacterized protein